MSSKKIPNRSGLIGLGFTVVLFCAATVPQIIPKRINRHAGRKKLRSAVGIKYGLGMNGMQNQNMEIVTPDERILSRTSIQVTSLFTDLFWVN
jgi:hypothetical protein